MTKKTKKIVATSAVALGIASSLMFGGESKTTTISREIHATPDETIVLDAVLKDKYPVCDVSKVTIEYCTQQYINLLEKMGDVVKAEDVNDPVKRNLYNRVKEHSQKY